MAGCSREAPREDRRRRIHAVRYDNCGECGRLYAFRVYIYM